MRWIFALLVLANVGLWLWATGFAPAPQTDLEPARPPVNAGKMRLISEPGVSLQPRVSGDNAGGRTLTAVTPLPVCYRVGPFADPAAAKAAQARLNDLKLPVVPQTETRQQAVGYRVYLPALATRAAAERRHRELVRLGFRDNYVITEPELRNAVSLGVFSVEANARARVRQLERRRIHARVQTLYQTRSAFWLEARAPADQAGQVTALRWAGAVTVHPTPCTPDRAVAAKGH